MEQVLLGDGSFIARWSETHIQRARALFLERLGILAPEACVDLRARCEEAYRQHLDGHGSEGFIWMDPLIRDGSYFGRPSSIIPCLDEVIPADSVLGESLRAWAKEWGLGGKETGSFESWFERLESGADWVLEAALYTLEREEFARRHLDGSTCLPAKIFHPPFFTESVPTKFANPDPVHGWNPGKETVSDFHARTRLHEEEVNRYLGRTNHGLDDTGARPGEPGTSFRRTPTKLISHFDMLVRWQVLKETKTRLSREFGISKDAVDDALERTAALIGLPLRKGQPGRPKRS